MIRAIRRGLFWLAFNGRLGRLNRYFLRLALQQWARKLPPHHERPSRL
jgi:hypothetical protein